MSELDDFLKRNNITLPEETGEETEDDSRAPVAGIGIGREVTEETEAARPQEYHHKGLYGEKPTVGPILRTRAAVQDGFDFLNGDVEKPPAPAQVERDAIEAEQQEYDTRAQEIFDTTGYQTDGQGRVYERWGVDDNGNPVIQERVQIPPPNSNMFQRVLVGAVNEIYEQTGGLLTEGAISTESNLEQENPDIGLSGGESLLRDVLAIGGPVLGGIGAARKGLNVARGANAGRAGVASTIAADSIGASVAEMVMAEGGDRGLIISKEGVEQWSKGAISGDDAADIAMFTDGLLINGTLDGVLRLIGGGIRAGSNKVKGMTGLFDKSKLVEMARNGSVMDVITMLDPGITDLPARQVKQRINELARVLNENESITMTLGSTVKEIPVDTTRALMGGAEAYIRTTRQGMRDTLSPPEFDAMVAEESANMVDRMISLQRTLQGTSAVRSTGERITNEMGEVFFEEAGRRVPAGSTVDETVTQSADELVRLRNQDVATAQGDIAAADRSLNTLRTDEARVVQDNPAVQDLLSRGGTGRLAYDEGAYRDEINKIVSDDLYPEFKRTMDDVDARYSALPNVPVDISMMHNELKDVVRKANEFDPSGAKAKSILRHIFQPFEPRLLGQNAAGDDVFENLDEVFARLEGNVGFADLYQVKAGMARLIDDQADPAIRNRLIDFRNHITAQDGQLGYVMNNNPPDVADQFRAADDAYKAAMSRFRNSEPMERLSDDMGKVRAYEGSSADYPGPFQRGEPDMRITGSQILEQSTEDSTRTLFRGLEYALQGVKSGAELRTPFVEYYIANGTRQLAEAIARGDTQTENMIMSSFDGVRQQLHDAGATDFLKKLDTDIEDIATRRKDLGDDILATDDIRTAADTRLREAENGILSGLMSTANLGAVRSDPRSYFRGMLTQEDAGNKIGKLQEQIARLPAEQQAAAQGALEAVALETIGHRVFGATPTGLKSGSETTRNIALGKVVQMSTDEAGNLTSALSQIFGADNPVVAGVQMSLDAIYKSSVPARLKISQSGSDTAANISMQNQSMRDAVSTGILLTFGYMNPTAAMARRLTAEPLKKAEVLQKQVAQDALIAMVTSPKDFATMIGLIDKGLMDDAKDLAMSIGKAASRTARYNIRVVEDEDEDNGLGGAMDQDMIDAFSR